MTRIVESDVRERREPLQSVGALSGSAREWGSVSTGSDDARSDCGQGWIQTRVRSRGQIYSLLPLTTRPPVHGSHPDQKKSVGGASLANGGLPVNAGPWKRATIMKRGHRTGKPKGGYPRFWGRHAVTAALANQDRKRCVEGTRGEYRVVHG